jgi:tetratricopeptide (TPR) repeat protein
MANHAKSEEKLAQAEENLAQAKKNLAIALRIGTRNIRAMTLYRIGRVRMAEKSWDKAEKSMQTSLKYAQRIPDYVYWLASIARLTLIAAEKKEYYRREEFNQMLAECPHKFEENNFGLARIALARLALGQKSPNIETIMEYLQKGIEQIAKFGPYARSSNIASRLTPIEEEFSTIPPKKIRIIGQRLYKHFSEEELETSVYSAVTPIMSKWANWKREGGDQ